MAKLKYTTDSGQEDPEITNGIQEVLGCIPTNDFVKMSECLFAEGNNLEDKLIHKIIGSNPKRSIKLLWESGILKDLLQSKLPISEKSLWVRIIFQAISSIPQYKGCIRCGEQNYNAPASKRNTSVIGVSHFQIDNNGTDPNRIDATDCIKIFPDGHIEISFLQENGTQFEFTWPVSLDAAGAEA